MKRRNDLHLHDDDQGKSESTAGIETPPPIYDVLIQGTAPILFHRWDCAAVEAKGAAKKNSAEKKTDNLESYVYRCQDGTLGMPADNFHACLAMAAKSKADPRSPRKSARDLVNAVILVEPLITSFGVKHWDYEDRRRVTIQRAGITRVRPALHEGWRLNFRLTVLDTSYINEIFLRDLVSAAGRYCGIGDHRPQFGRFSVSKWSKIEVR